MKLIINILMLIVLLDSCQFADKYPENKKIREKEIIEKVIRNSIEWAQSKDTSLLYGTIANDSNYLEIDPENRVVKGITNFKKGEKFWLDPRFKAIKCEIWDLNINISHDGTVAWYYCMLNDINEWNGEPCSWMNTRWTGVLEKRNREWVIVQMHFSYAQQ